MSRLHFGRRTVPNSRGRNENHAATSMAVTVAPINAPPVRLSVATCIHFSDRDRLFFGALRREAQRHSGRVRCRRPPRALAPCPCLAQPNPRATPCGIRISVNYIPYRARAAPRCPCPGARIDHATGGRCVPHIHACEPPGIERMYPNEKSLPGVSAGQGSAIVTPLERAASDDVRHDAQLSPSCDWLVVDPYSFTFERSRSAARYASPSLCASTCAICCCAAASCCGSTAVPGITAFTR